MSAHELAFSLPGLCSLAGKPCRIGRVAQLGLQSGLPAQAGRLPVRAARRPSESLSESQSQCHVASQAAAAFKLKSLIGKFAVILTVSRAQATRPAACTVCLGSWSLLCPVPPALPACIPPAGGQQALLSSQPLAAPTPTPFSTSTAQAERDASDFFRGGTLDYVNPEDGRRLPESRRVFRSWCAGALRACSRLRLVHCKLAPAPVVAAQLLLQLSLLQRNKSITLCSAAAHLVTFASWE